MKTLALAAAAAGLMAIAAPAAAAPVIGDAMTCTATGFSCSNSNATLGAGPEFTARLSGLSFLSFDFSDGLLTLSNALDTTFGVWGKTSFSFADLDRPFGEATLLSGTGFTGLSQANFTTANGVLTFASTGFSASKDASLTLRLTSVGAVPEPAAWSMMILGVGMVGFALRRREAVRTVNA